MAPALQIFYALAFILLHLPLLSIAFPTAIEPRDALRVLSELLTRVRKGSIHADNLGAEGSSQCIAVPWHLKSHVVMHSHEQDDVQAMILIETTMGVALCFVPSSDLDQMLPGSIIDEPKYNELFYERLLGRKGKGQLTNVMLQMIEWNTEGRFEPPETCPVMVVIDFQIGAPGHDGSFDHHTLIRRMAVDMRDDFKAYFATHARQPDWKMPTYTGVPKIICKIH